MHNDIFLYSRCLDNTTMQLPELARIVMLRKKMGLTQTELAKKAGISQSLIARVEAGTVDPRYSKVEKIFRALDVSESRTITAKEIMSKDVVSVKPTDLFGYAIKKLKKHNVSQIPVLDGKTPVGSLSEGVIMAQITKGADMSVIASKKVKDYMEDPLPQVSPGTDISTLSSLLEHNKAVLITEKGKVEGIVTKADLLKVVR